MGFIMLFGCGGWIGPTGNMFCLRVGTSHTLSSTLSRTTILAANDHILHNSGKKALKQQSNGMVERFLLVDDGH